MISVIANRAVVAAFVSVFALVAGATPLPDVTSQPALVDGVLAVISGVAAFVAAFSKPPGPAE